MTRGGNDVIRAIAVRMHVLSVSILRGFLPFVPPSPVAHQICPYIYIFSSVVHPTYVLALAINLVLSSAAILDMDMSATTAIPSSARATHFSALAFH